MKISILICILALAAAAGCKRALPAGAVSFDGPGIVLVPGADWQQMDAGRPSVLRGHGQFEGGTIDIHWTAVPSGAESEVKAIRSKVAAEPEVLQDSIQQEAFVSDSRVRGIHLSYELSVVYQGAARKFRQDGYFFQNAKRHCVGIGCLTPADRDCQAVHQMILKTLSLQ
jgi:hypothetical protein